MVTREYTCKRCGKDIEQKDSIKAPVLKECPDCGGPLRTHFGWDNDVLWFNNPKMGAITNRFKANRRG